MKCDELKDYDIMDIEAMDDERLEKSESGKIQVTRVYIKSEADAAIAELKVENRRLKRALWMSRKAHAVAMFAYWDKHYRDNPSAVYRNRTIGWLRNRWLLILDAIIKKEKEYK